jgi:hypothetical protein
MYKQAMWQNAMLQEVIHILVLTVQIFVIIIPITCLGYTNGGTSMCNALQKQMRKFTFYIPELQA